MGSAEKKLSVKELKGRTDGNEMDLSLMAIANVPVKEIASIPKANSIDLSCNQILCLPYDFCNTLNYLIKLDLSKNQIRSLPEDIYKLEHLKHLDLFQNQLCMIPVGFSRLSSLKWLDLKDNPLDASYSKVVGDCLDDKQCRLCALNLVTAMKTLASDQERQRQKALQAQREKERAKRMEEERKNQQKKVEKKLEKERRRKEWEAQQRKGKYSEQESTVQESDLGTETAANSPNVQNHFKTDRNAGRWIFNVYTLLFVLLASILVGFFYCGDNPTNPYCILFKEKTETVWELTQVYSKHGLNAFNSATEFVRIKLEIFKAWSLENLNNFQKAT